MGRSESAVPSPPSFKSWLLVTGIVAALPLLSFSLLAGRALLKQQHETANAQLEHRAEVAAREVSREVRMMYSALETLALSDAALRGDYEALYAHSRRVAESFPRIGSISAVDLTGERRFTTLAPFGAKLPASNLGKFDKLVLESGENFVSPLVSGSVSGRQVVALYVPVKSQSKTSMALRLTLWSESVEELIHEQQWPITWTAAVIDQNMSIIARSRTPKRYVGQAASDEIQEAIRSKAKGVFDSVTKDGMAVTASVLPIAGTQWHVAVGAPTESLDAQVLRALNSVLWIGLVCGLLAVVGALYQANVWRRHARQLLGENER